MRQTSPTPVKRSRGRRIGRALAWTLLGFVMLVLVLAGGAWWWIGSSDSLAFALTRAARFLPPGQSLESRDVSGSLRFGGRIGWLRWQNEGLSVEVQDARIGWQLAPLLQRKVQLGEVHAASIAITPRAPAEDQPAEPLEPLAPIVLPVEVDLPFRVDALRWAGPPELTATGLAGRYRYVDAHHRLEVDGVDIADGHYGARVDLQGPAPMALEAALEGRVRAPLAGEHSLDVRAEAMVRGTLAGEDARLRIEARLDPVEEGAEAPMQAELQANIAPWRTQPVIDATADLRDVDLARLWPDAPATRLSGRIEAGPAPGAAETWQGTARIRNDLPGPWDSGKLPLEQLEARAGFDGTTWTLPTATLRVGGGRIEAEGRWSPAPEPWQAEARVRSVQPGALHTELAGAPVSGRLAAEQQGEAIAFDVALQAEGSAGSKALDGLRLERATARGQWEAQVLDLGSLRIDAAGGRVEGRLQVRTEEQAGAGDLRLTAPGADVRIQGRIAPSSGEGQVQARVDDAGTLQRWIEGLPGLSALFAGTVADGTANLDARWRGGWQAIQRRLQNATEPAARGATEPTLAAMLSVPRLDLRLPAAATSPSSPATPPSSIPAATTLQLRELRAELDGSLAQATLSLAGEARTGERRITLDLRGSGGLERARQWRAAIDSLRVQASEDASSGPWVLALERPVNATVRTDGTHLDVQASAAAATLRGPAPGTVRIDWEPLHFSQGGTAPDRAYRLQSRGRLQGLPMAWTEAFGGGAALTEAGISGDLVFDGEWDIDAGDALRARIRLLRESGDIRVQAGEAALVTRITSRGTGTASEREMNAAADTPSTPAGLRQAEVQFDAEGERVRATLAWDSERAGTIRAEAETRLQRRPDGWQWAPDAPIAGRLDARLPNLGVWSMLAPPGWRVAGTLEADATLSGRRDDPRWNGNIRADQLALRALVEGLDLRDGRLRASLTGNRLVVDEFTLRGGAASKVRVGGQSGNLSTVASEAARDGGTLSVQGEVGWGAAEPAATGSGIRMALQARLQALRVLVRSDRQVTLSGDLRAQLAAGQISVRGDLRTDRAVIILPDETAPGLGSDVVVHSAAKDREAALQAQRQATRDAAQAARAQTAKPPDIQVGFDLGDDFAVQGRGLTTRLEGKLDIRSTRLDAPPRITGEVRTVKGQYRAYGQQLDVETGIARFSGTMDNPALDILAVRPNIAQRAGVRISGTAQSPRVRLYSEPALSDAETLSWVVLGRASATGGSESLLLQQAALALLGGLGKGSGGGNLASRFGLDEIGFRGPGSGGDVRDSAVTVGKRVAKDFYLTYERSLSGTLGTLFIFYDLTRRLTLRAQAGQQSGVDLIYTLQYD